MGGTDPNTGEGQSEGCTKIVVCTLNVATVKPYLWALPRRDAAGFLIFF